MGAFTRTAFSTSAFSVDAFLFDDLPVNDELRAELIINSVISGMGNQFELIGLNFLKAVDLIYTPFKEAEVISNPFKNLVCLDDKLESSKVISDSEVSSPLDNGCFKVIVDQNVTEVAEPTSQNKSISDSIENEEII